MNKQFQYDLSLSLDSTGDISPQGKESSKSVTIALKSENDKSFDFRHRVKYALNKYTELKKEYIYKSIFFFTTSQVF